MGRVSLVRCESSSDPAGMFAALTDQTTSTRLVPFGSGLYLKDETGNAAGSFKLRGVLEAVRAHDGVQAMVTVSTGNTGIAAAVVSQSLGWSCEVWLPKDATVAKTKRLERLGATVVIANSSFSDTATRARRSARRRHCLFIAPGSTQTFLLGLTAIFREVFEQQPDVSTLFVPCGGGGLLSAAVLARRRVGVDVRVLGVQAWSSRPVFNLWHRRPPDGRVDASYADCLSGDLEADAQILALVDEVDDLRLVTRRQLRAARGWVEDRLSLKPELGAVAGIAAWLETRPQGSSVAILTGRTSMATTP